MKYHNRIYLLFLAIIINTSVQSQEVTSQSFKTDSLHFRQLRDSFGYYLNRNLTKATFFAKEAMQFAEQKEVKEWQYIGYGNYAVALRCNEGREERKEASVYLDKSRKIAIAMKDTTKMITISNEMINGYRLESIKKALKLALDNLRISKSYLHKKRDSFNLASAYCNLGLVYRDLKLYDSAITNFRNSYKDFSAMNSNFQYVALLYEGESHGDKSDYEKALIRYKEAENGFKKNNIARYLSITYEHISKTYNALEYNEKAIVYAKKALKIEEPLVRPYLNLATSYYKLNKLDSANYYLDKLMIVNNQDINYLPLEIKYNTLRAQILEKQGNASKAFPYYKNNIVLEDSLSKIENTSKSVAVLLKEKAKNKEYIETKYSAALDKKDQLIIGLSILILLIAICLFIIFFRHKSKFNFLNTKQQKLSAELKEVLVQKEYVTHKMGAVTADLVVKNDLLHNINQTLNRLKENNVSKGIQKNIKTTQNSIRTNLELNKIWQDFFTHFEEVTPDFFSILSSQYNLSPNDLKLCAFIKMNLSIKEISLLLNVKLNSVHVGVHRIKKKLNLPSETNVFEFLQSELCIEEKITNAS